MVMLHTDAELNAGPEAWVMLGDPFLVKEQSVPFCFAGALLRPQVCRPCEPKNPVREDVLEGMMLD